MNVVLWIAAILLALAFLAAGSMKLRRSKEQIRESGMAWVESFSPGTIKLIGAAEVLGAGGLILPPALGIAPVLAPLAATGLAVIMVGAIVTHARLGERQQVVVNLVLLILAVFVAIERFGSYAF